MVLDRRPSCSWESLRVERYSASIVSCKIGADNQYLCVKRVTNLHDGLGALRMDESYTRISWQGGKAVLGTVVLT